ncbi:MAG: polyhydroxyalkanoate synthesis regulator phasin [Candidatus Azotimanducaceae bacterium]|jgi:polyhydroxyalkanoate synthesis regulator phasin
MTNTTDPTTAQPNGGNSKKGRNSKTGIGLAAGLLGGTAAGLVLGVPAMSSAAADTGTVVAPAAIVQQVDDAPADDAPVQPGERLRTVLQPLVDDGTIDAAQADAVTAQLMENRGEHGPGKLGEHGPGKFGPSDVVTDLLGIDAATLRSELQAGSTLAEVATTQGVSVDVLVDAIVDQMQERVDAAVEAGKITADEAAEKLAEAEARITAKVNGETLADD